MGLWWKLAEGAGMWGKYRMHSPPPPHSQTLHAFRWTHPSPLVSSKHEPVRPDEYMLLISSLEAVFPDGITSYSSNIKSNCFVLFIFWIDLIIGVFLSFCFFLWRPFACYQRHHPSSVHVLKSKCCQLKNKRRLIHWWRFPSPVFSPTPKLPFTPVTSQSFILCENGSEYKSFPRCFFFSLIGPACVVLGQSISLTNADNYKRNVSVA